MGEIDEREQEDRNIINAVILNRAKGNKIFIIAGSYQQAEYYVREAELKREEWVYVSDIHKLTGYMSPKYVKVGTYYWRDNIKMIDEALAMRFGDSII